MASFLFHLVSGFAAFGLFIVAVLIGFSSLFFGSTALLFAFPVFGLACALGYLSYLTRS